MRQAALGWRRALRSLSSGWDFGAGRFVLQIKQSLRKAAIKVLWLTVAFWRAVPVGTKTGYIFTAQGRTIADVSLHRHNVIAAGANDYTGE